ncbi:MAG: ferrous iron transporter C [Gammaproteobacteria bacterium]|nr:MAG: ferrous iron transporter C [Gammaproteobacteria bacterium]
MPIKTNQNSAIQLLILHESQDEAEQLINDLRNFGHATRAHQTSDEADLLDALNGGHWDLFLARPHAGSLDYTQALKLLAELDKDVPFILLANDNDSDTTTAALIAGAQDVVPVGERERLKLVVTRELNNLFERRLRRKAEIRLNESEKRCTLLLDSSRDAITYVHDGMHIYANEAYVEMFGYEDSEELEGMPIMDMISQKDKDAFKDFLRNYDQHESNKELTCRGIKTDGAEIKAHMQFSPATYDSEPCTQIILRIDKNNAELEEKLRAISCQDLLTGLFNRQYFLEKLDKAIIGATEKGQRCATFYIILDNFEEVKNTIGIGDADIVLTDVAGLLKKISSEEDLVARFSDDVFTIIHSSGIKKTALEFGEKIRTTIEGHLYQVQERTVQLTASVGISLVQENAPSSQELISRAHQAALEVRGKGNAVSLFSPKIVNDSEVSIIQQLEKSLDEGKLILLYQPIINLRGDSTELYEILLRMVDEQGNQVSAGDFLSAAANAGLSEKIDRWVILQAIKVLTEHRAEGHDTRIFINLTEKSIQDPSFLPWLNVAFKAARLPTEAIIFQILEADANAYLKNIKTFTEGLTQLHCKLAINRFGTATNPFNLLKHIDADYLKIDPAFTQDIADDDNKEKLKDLINQAHELDKRTIVPFVENATILSTLWQLGTNYIQGHYLQVPSEKMDYDFSNEG